MSGIILRNFDNNLVSKKVLLLPTEKAGKSLIIMDQIRKNVIIKVHKVANLYFTLMQLI